MEGDGIEEGCRGAKDDGNRRNNDDGAISNHANLWRRRIFKLRHGIYCILLSPQRS